MRPEKIADAMGLRSLGRNQSWYVQSCSAATGEGLFEGLEWLHRTLREKTRGARAG